MFLISYKKDNFNAKKSYKNYYYNAKLGGHHNDTKQKTAYNHSESGCQHLVDETRFVLGTGSYCKH